MYTCKNCGGALKYDIASGQLKCDSCDTQYDPYAVTQEQDAERDDYDVTVFKCPQCGGEIYSTDNTAAGFCSFCGASTVLSSRLVKEKKVDYLIPFKKTKEDCKQAYGKLMRRALYAPKELKDPTNIDGFRGIYMPYWVYHVKQQGHVKLHGTKSYRRGDYIITKHYGLHMDVDAQYKGLSYDASSAFSDDISAKMSPYDVKNMKPFTPSLLSGFYADMSDVEADIYAQDAKAFSADATTNRIRRSPEIAGYALENAETIPHKIPPHIVSTDSAMMPVWFLSYRNRDRVAYAAVNGQTGRVVADLPVDIRKYLLGCVIFAVPIILLLNLFLTLTPSALLALVSILATCVIALHAHEMKQIAVKENYEDDKGIQSAKEQQEKMARQRAKEQMGAGVEEPYVLTKEQMRRNEKGQKKAAGKKTLLEGTSLGSIIVIVGIVFFGCGFLSAFESLFQDMPFILYMIILVIAASAFGYSMKQAKRIDAKKHNGDSVWALIAVIVCAVIGFINPVSDLWYYGGAIGAMVTMCFTLIDIIVSYNILATRRLPQFDHKGGDDLA